MSEPGKNDLKLTIYGLEIHGDEVDAVVFADKLKKLVSGLKKLDAFYNAKGQHKFMIHDLEFASATVMLREKVMKSRSVRKSPSMRFVEIGAAAASGAPLEIENAADEYALGIYKGLSSGAGKSFSYGVVSAEKQNPIRLDNVLERRVDDIISNAISVAETAPPRFFRGTAIETYDGVMKLVDIRGLFPEAKLILSAGGKEVSCVISAEKVEDLRASLGRRALVTGRAQHDGRSMIPERIDVTSIKVIKDAAPNIISLKGQLSGLDAKIVREAG